MKRILLFSIALGCLLPLCGCSDTTGISPERMRAEQNFRKARGGNGQTGAANPATGGGGAPSQPPATTGN